jgi:hypothetical protein
MLRCVVVGVVAVVLAACGGGGDPIEDYYPVIPDPTGEPQAVFAGEVTTATAGELVAGPAATGMVGDLFLRNDRATFIISAPARVIGVVPQGGNLIDAVLRDGSGPLVEDHFGELGLLYVLGRTCEHDSIEVIRDGAGGGVAAIRARGHTGNNDFINFRGFGLFTVEDEVDPDIDDGVECATTYVLAPGSTTLQTYFTLYNPGDREVRGPFGTIADIGGVSEQWGNGRGFERLTLSASSFSTSAPLDYTLFQAPGVAYGILPRDPTPAASSAYLIAGASVFLFGNPSLLDILDDTKYFLHLPAKKGYLQAIEVAIGRDAEDIDSVWRTGKGEALIGVGGTVTWSTGGAAIGARVGVYRDAGGDGAIDDPVGDTPGDAIVSYLDVAADGTFSGLVPSGPGLLLRAEVKDQGRSPAMVASDAVSLVIPAPVRIDYSIVDDATGNPIPGRILVVGDHLAFPDQRVFETYDRVPLVVQQVHAIRGSTSLGADPDPALFLPSGGTYRIYASRGTEWSYASQPITGTADETIELRLRHLMPTPGYLGTDWHIHQVGSPDSPVPSDERVRGAVSAGVEMFAITDHDFVADLQPVVEQLEVEDQLRVVPGIEVTPFAYGHFISWPLEPDPSSPNRGAIDWARGMAGFAMTPGEIFSAMRDRGGQLVLITHPRATSGLGEFQAFFDRAKLTYDYSVRTIFGDFAGAPVPNSFLRLPDASLWDDTFNTLEVWNGFRCGSNTQCSGIDTDGDGVRENSQLDRVLRDWFNMLSLGKVVTPLGNTDTHTNVIDPVGGPRTYVRVSDDSGAALASGASVDEVNATLTGATPRDIVITDGPMIEVTAAGAPAIGATLAATGGTITLEVRLTSPDWAAIDTLELFANATPDIVPNNQTRTAMTPLKCWTSRDVGMLDPADPCANAPIEPEPLAMPLVSVPGAAGFRRYEATVTITIDAADIVNRTGATGQDAWLVLRVRGDRGIFPLMPLDTLDATTLPVILAGDPAAIAAAMDGKGPIATAFTGAIFVDFDGGGYRAPFAP